MSGAPITLATLPQATAQQVLDQVARHLLTQGATSYGRGAIVCAYRSDGGWRCAAGCLIADDEYREDWEGQNWANLCREGLVPVTHRALILDLQGLHDCAGPDTWERGLAVIAQRHRLQMPDLAR
ncbi:MAG: hypothetical protein RJA99_4269 [Pseudomonadota bacterium]